MKRIIAWLGIIVAGMTVLTSCLGDDDDSSATTYSDTAIIRFTLGTMNRYTSSTSSKTGNDTIIKSTVSGSVYPMTIDQLGCVIYNAAELPAGTDVAHVVCTVSTKNGGVVTLKSLTSDTLRLHSATDSIDFTQPRLFRVYATDGVNFRDYTVSLKVATTSGDTRSWQLVKTDAGLAGWTDARLAPMGDSVLLQPRDSILLTTATERIAMGTDGHLKRSVDQGQSWQDEPLDDDGQLLPAPGTAVAVSWPYASADDTDYLLLVGQPRQQDVSTMRVWRKLSPHKGGGEWVYMPEAGNRYPLPLLQGLTMACHDGSVLALGSDGVMRQSRDQGLSWRTASGYTLPSQLTGTAFLMATDEGGRLWLLTDSGQLWRWE